MARTRRAALLTHEVQAGLPGCGGEVGGRQREAQGRGEALQKVLGFLFAKGEAPAPQHICKSFVVQETWQELEKKKKSQRAVRTKIPATRK